MKDRAQIMSWRRAERDRLIQARLRMPVAERQLASARIAAQLDQYCTSRGLLVPGCVISGYWPLRGEPDLRPWLAKLHEAGFTCALPVVETRGEALAFRRWSPGCAMEKGFWDIPVPADRTPCRPDILLAPVVGFDDAAYRLGYGGGYFDRTLARLGAQGAVFHALGVGYPFAQIATIHPLPHDIALETVITGGRWLPGLESNQRPTD